MQIFIQELTQAFADYRMQRVQQRYDQNALVQHLTAHQGIVSSLEDALFPLVKQDGSLLPMSPLD